MKKICIPKIAIWISRYVSYQELITPRNSHVAGAQVPTCSKFTADKLDSYSKIVFILYQIWCKIYSCNWPLLKIHECLNNFEEIKFNSCKPFPQLIHWSLRQPLTARLGRLDYFYQWSVVSHSHWRCWWGMQEAEQGNIRCQGDWSHSPCPLGAPGKKPTLWSATGCDIFSHFTGYGMGCQRP